MPWCLRGLDRWTAIRASLGASRGRTVNDVLTAGAEVNELLSRPAPSLNGIFTTNGKGLSAFSFCMS